MACSVVNIRMVVSSDRNNHRDMGKDLFIDQHGVGAKKMSIYNAQFIGVSQMDWTELFSGFNELYAITYSSSIKLMRQLFEKFLYTETVFGFPEVMGTSQKRLSSLQLSVLKTITSEKDTLKLAEMMEMGKVRLFVSNDVKSHEKLFILKGEDKYRIIIGSANMSVSAFNGVQREIVCMLEGREVYETFFELYCSIRDQCTSPVFPDKIRKAIENGEDIAGDLGNAPIIDDVLRSGKAKEFEETDDPDSSDDYVFDIEDKLFGDSDPSKNNELWGKPQKSNGYRKSYITPESAREAIKRANEQRNKELVLPSMDIDYNKGTISIHSKYMDLNPNSTDIQEAIHLVKSYFGGWDMVNKDASKLKRTYWKLLVWYFAAPFIPHLRYLAENNGRDINFKYPTYILLYGKSNSGKSKFLDFMTRLMTGHDGVIREGNSITAGKLRKEKAGCKNLPLNIDELSVSRWNSYRSLIKEDFFGKNIKQDSYAPIAFVSNDVMSVPLDIRKRCVVCHFEANMELSKTIGNEKFMGWLDSANENTALYREFASRMLIEVNRLSQMIENKEDCPTDNILHISSVILKEIFEEYGELPEYVRELTLAGDYFDALEMGCNATQTLEIGLKIEPDLFSIDFKENLLIYRNPNYDAKKLQNICKELPVEWDAKVGLGSLAMNYEEASKVLSLDTVTNRMGQKRSGIDQLRMSLKVEPEQFFINELEDLLVFKTSNGDVSRLIEIQKELPSDWESSLTLNSLVVSLSKAKEFLDLKNVQRIKSSFWGKFFKGIK